MHVACKCFAVFKTRLYLVVKRHTLFQLNDDRTPRFNRIKEIRIPEGKQSALIRRPVPCHMSMPGIEPDPSGDKQGPEI